MLRPDQVDTLLQLGAVFGVQIYHDSRSRAWPDYPRVLVPLTYYFNAEHEEVGHQLLNQDLVLFDPPRKWHMSFCNRFKVVAFCVPEVQKPFIERVLN